MKNLKNDVEMLIALIKEKAETEINENKNKKSGTISIDADMVYNDTEYLHVEIEVAFDREFTLNETGTEFIENIYLTPFLKEVVLITESNEYELTKLFSI